MEDNLVLEGNQPQYAPKPKRDIMPILSLSIAAVAILIAAGSWYFTNNAMTAKIDDLTAKYESRLDSAHKENELLKTSQKALSDQVRAMENIVFLNAIAREIEGATVTDDFAVEKVYLVASESGTLGSIVIDVQNQPDMTYIYKGKGSYELSDRELRAKCDAIIKAVATRYGNREVLPAWDENTWVTVTVLNYEIGSMQGGEFKLVGESK